MNIFDLVLCDLECLDMILNCHHCSLMLFLFMFLSDRLRETIQILLVQCEMHLSEYKHTS